LHHRAFRANKRPHRRRCPLRPAGHGILARYGTSLTKGASRPQQLHGGDRELVILSGLGAALMAVSVMTFLSFLIAFLGFGAIVAVLARIGNADPMMRRVYSRHLQYKDFYPAKSGVTSLGKTPKRSWR
jgi:type IV secretion system protein TrbD